MIKLGWFSDLASLIIGHKPTTEEFAVWLSPGQCTWDYVPTQNYRVVRRSIGPAETAAYYAWESELSDSEAIISIAARNLPRPEQLCMVVDAYNQIVLGWYHDGETVAWNGCEVMFRLLELIHNPVDVALWSLGAKEYADQHSTMEAHLNARPPAPHDS